MIVAAGQVDQPVGEPRAQGLSTFAVPVNQLAVVVAIAAVAGVGAAILPARRATRLNVLEAITSE